MTALAAAERRDRLAASWCRFCRHWVRSTGACGAGILARLAAGEPMPELRTIEGEERCSSFEPARGR